MPLKKKSGRPRVTKYTQVVSILVSSFQNGMTVRQACIQAGISREAYYSNLRFDDEFADKMWLARHYATISAKATIIAAIKKGDIKTAQWWLEKKGFEEDFQEYGEGAQEDSDESADKTMDQYPDESNEDFEKRIYRRTLYNLEDMGYGHEEAAALAQDYVYGYPAEEV